MPDEDASSRTVILGTRAGDWNVPGSTEADTATRLRDAGYQAHVVHDAASLITTLDASGPTVVALDWRMLGFTTEEDLWRAETYNPLWELSRDLNNRYRHDLLVGVMVISDRSWLKWDGMTPIGALADMYLTYPFTPEELLSFVRRLHNTPQPRHTPFWDDRRKEV